MEEFSFLESYLIGKIVILGIGNILRGDDGAGSLLASRLKGRISLSVYDCAESLENYLGKIIKELPQTVVMVDAVDFGGRPGEVRLAKEDEFKTANLFFTHNASLNLAINYLQSCLRANIIIIMIQPRSIGLKDTLGPEVEEAVNTIERFFLTRFGK